MFKCAFSVGVPFPLKIMIWRRYVINLIAGSDNQLILRRHRINARHSIQRDANSMCWLVAYASSRTSGCSE